MQLKLHKYGRIILIFGKKKKKKEQLYSLTSFKIWFYSQETIFKFNLYIFIAQLALYYMILYYKIITFPFDKKSGIKWEMHFKNKYEYEKIKFELKNHKNILFMEKI